MTLVTVTRAHLPPRRLRLRQHYVLSFSFGRVETTHVMPPAHTFQLSLPFLSVHGQIMSSSIMSGGQSVDHMKEGKW